MRQPVYNILINFLLPIQKAPSEDLVNIKTKRSVVIVPTYRPTSITVKLVKSLVDFNRDLNLSVLVVDDSSPTSSQTIFDQILSINKSKVTVIHTPTNSLKAGAINFGLSYLEKNRQATDVIFTVDDDIVIKQPTIRLMLVKLYENNLVGAVCSLAKVLNKNVNLLTRLQGLEYNFFNVIRVADNNFIQGPLVMHGMISAFKYTAIKQVGGFRQNHIIEDYEITARLKNIGWYVALSPRAEAFTVVPETITHLWRQRVRWSFGGIQVVLSKNKLTSIIQDVIGHLLFISTLVLLALSFLISPSTNNFETQKLVILISLISFTSSFIFFIYTLSFYREKDWIDTVIRLTFVLEIFYSQILTFILLGSYLFYVYTKIRNRLSANTTKKLHFIDQVLSNLGYSQRWGTR